MAALPLRALPGDPWAYQEEIWADSVTAARLEALADVRRVADDLRSAPGFRVSTFRFDRRPVAAAAKAGP